MQRCAVECSVLECPLKGTQKTCQQFSIVLIVITWIVSQYWSRVAYFYGSKDNRNEPLMVLSAMYTSYILSSLEEIVALFI